MNILRQCWYKFLRLLAVCRSGNFNLLLTRLKQAHAWNYLSLTDQKAYQKWFARRVERSIIACEPLPTAFLSIWIIGKVGHFPQTLTSVISQSYGHWEVWVDQEENPHDLPIYSYASPEESISRGAMFNDLLSRTRGEHVLILLAGDQLATGALLHYARAIESHPEASFFYGDEDRIDQQGLVHSPYFKPDFSPELLYSVDYVSRGVLFQKKAVIAAGGFTEQWPVCQEYDMAFRLKNQPIHHITEILYHHTSVQEKILGEISPQVVSHHLPAEVTILAQEADQVFHQLKLFPSNAWPKVSIVIPTKNKVTLLKACIQSILTKTDYPTYEILVLDNQSDDTETLHYFDSLRETSLINVISFPYPYNYSAINNYGVHFAAGEVVCFLNNDIEIISPHWLTEMSSWLQRPGVGAVGAKLYYPNETIQHAGMHGLRMLGTQQGFVTHAYRTQPRSSIGYYHQLQLVQNVCAVTGACLLMRKSLFLQVGGFDSENTPTGYSDTDLCFRIREAGFRIVWTPYAEAYHHEGVSRGADSHRNQQGYLYMQRRWGDFWQDPYVNPHLSYTPSGCPVLLKD